MKSIRNQIPKIEPDTFIQKTIPEGGNTYGNIKFTTSQTNRISIPYGERFGGANIDGPPCTLNGFTGARNGEIIPEWMLNNRVTPDEGSELHKVVDGIYKIIGIFDGTKFVPIN